MEHILAMNNFDDLEQTPANHFKLYFYAAILRVLEQTCLALGSPEAALEQFPFLGSYHNTLAARGLEGCPLPEASTIWQAAIESWEARASSHLPLRALRAAAGLNQATLTAWMLAGLIEEDSRFGSIFESLQGTPGGRRPINSLLALASSNDADPDGRMTVRQLESLGLVEPLDPHAPWSEQALHIPAPLWEAAHGDVPATPAPGLHYRSPLQFIPLNEIIAPDSVHTQAAALPRLLQMGEVRVLIVRGPQHNGRRTLLGAVARELGRGLLEIQAHHPAGADEYARWRLAGPLATLLNALPVFIFDLGPGELVEIPELPVSNSPVFIVLGRQGAATGVGFERALTLTLDLPDAAARRRHWLAALGESITADLDQWSAQYRMTGGNIRRLAGRARTQALLAGRNVATPDDVREASRAMNRQALESLAALVEPLTDGWRSLCVDDETLQSLRLLESRCRHRERLSGAVGAALAAQLNAGVRVLFTGPSGAGKTLAARVLAGRLNLDLYRLDLSSIVSKYIGETEKNLSQIFARAEELGVILLLDEGDALLTARTGVQSSNDRYANLETNYLLQRLESYEGLLIITTNAADRIDGAFQRRMDLILQFRAPEAAERQTIWDLHLPERHSIEPNFLREVVYRCELTGGQIRNAALHATLLALNNGGVVTTPYLEAAVRREYRKLGAVCPLRRTTEMVEVN